MSYAGLTPRTHRSLREEFSKEDGLPGAQTSLRSLRKADCYAPRWRLGDPSRLGRRQADRMSDPELQSVTPVEISSGHPLAKALLALNNAHARELSWLGPERLEHLVQDRREDPNFPAGFRSGRS
jgi:hypothetical protein